MEKHLPDTYSDTLLSWNIKNAILYDQRVDICKSLNIGYLLSFFWMRIPTTQ